jgi:hypothetical protein
VEFPDDDQEPELAAQLADVARCTALCFAQQMLNAEQWAHPATERRAMLELIDTAGHGATDVADPGALARREVASDG